MNKTYYENASEEEKKFLDAYDPGDWLRPSVTADIVIFTVDPEGHLCVVLIKRKDYPYKDAWALPGGFLKVGEESVYKTAERELKEETGLSGVFLQQLMTYSDPDRDPRMHVVSVAHFALVPYSKLFKGNDSVLVAGDDADQVDLFQISKMLIGIQGYKEFAGYRYVFMPILSNYRIEEQVYGRESYSKDSYKRSKFQSYYQPGMIGSENLAFDHYLIIKSAIDRLVGRKDYCLDLFNLLENASEFTIAEYKRIYDAISFEKSDNANFRKMFKNRYVKTGIVESLERKTVSTKPAMLYKYVGKKEG